MEVEEGLPPTCLVCFRIVDERITDKSSPTKTVKAPAIRKKLSSIPSTASSTTKAGGSTGQTTNLASNPGTSDEEVATVGTDDLEKIVGEVPAKVQSAISLSLNTDVPPPPAYADDDEAFEHYITAIGEWKNAAVVKEELRKRGGDVMGTQTVVECRLAKSMVAEWRQEMLQREPPPSVADAFAAYLRGDMSKKTFQQLQEELGLHSVSPEDDPSSHVQRAKASNYYVKLLRSVKSRTSKVRPAFSSLVVVCG